MASKHSSGNEDSSSVSASDIEDYDFREDDENMQLNNQWRLQKVNFEQAKKSPEDLKKMKSKLGKFYKNQNELVDSFVRLNMLQTDSVQSDEASKNEEKRTLKVKIGVYGSFSANIILFCLKVFAASTSGSIAVIASALDSFLDLLSGSIIFIANYFKKRNNPYRYPAGKDRLEPLGVLIFSAVMFTATLQLMIESVQRLSGVKKEIDLSPLTIAIIGFTIVLKFFLFLYCRSINKSPSCEALAQDHRNDVVTNGVGAATALLGFYVAWWVDPVGGLLIGLYIMVNWFRTGYHHVVLLSGKTADNVFLQQITYICWQHDARIIKIDTVRAFHLGLGFLVEVDIVLPESMSLREAHDIGQSLQDKLELINTIERAFVHLDYETDHSPEHGQVKKIVDLFEQ